jgi:hypothetical protein
VLDILHDKIEVCRRLGGLLQAVGYAAGYGVYRRLSGLLKLWSDKVGCWDCRRPEGVQETVGCARGRGVCLRLSGLLEALGDRGFLASGYYC